MRHRAARPLMTRHPFHITPDEAAGLCTAVNTNRQPQGQRRNSVADPWVNRFSGAHLAWLTVKPPRGFDVRLCVLALTLSYMLNKLLGKWLCVLMTHGLKILIGRGSWSTLERRQSALLTFGFPRGELFFLFFLLFFSRPRKWSCGGDVLTSHRKKTGTWAYLPISYQ